MYKDKQFLFVVTYGRSGSTLLNGVLNSIPGYRICGENHMAFKSLWQFYRSMVMSVSASNNFERQFDQKGSCNSWNNPFSFLQVQDSVRGMVCDLFDSDDEYSVIGFKEIRYSGFDEDELFSFLRWLDYVFSPAKFVFLTRNLDEVCQSKWHSNNPEKCREQLSVFEDRVSRYIREVRDGQDWFHLHFNSLHDGSLCADDFCELFSFLGADFDRDAVDRVLGVFHGY